MLLNFCRKNPLKFLLKVTNIIMIPYNFSFTVSLQVETIGFVKTSTDLYVV